MVARRILELTYTNNKSRAIFSKITPVNLYLAIILKIIHIGPDKYKLTINRSNQTAEELVVMYYHHENRR